MHCLRGRVDNPRALRKATKQIGPLCPQPVEPRSRTRGNEESLQQNKAADYGTSKHSMAIYFFFVLLNTLPRVKFRVIEYKRQNIISFVAREIWTASVSFNDWSNVLQVVFAVGKMNGREKDLEKIIDDQKELWDIGNRTHDDPLYTPPGSSSHGEQGLSEHIVNMAISDLNLFNFLWQRSLYLYFYIL